MSDMSNQPDDFAGGWVNRVDLDSGEHTVLYREGPDHRFAGPNDIVFDAQGGFWFTDFGKTRARDADRGSLFYATVDGKHIVEAARGLNGPNGVGLSPGGRSRVRRRELHRPRPRLGRRRSGNVALAGSDGRRGDEGPLRLPRRRSGRGRRRRRARTTARASSQPTARATSTSRCLTASSRTSPSAASDMRTAYLTFSGGGRLVSCDWPRPGLKLAF